MKNVPPHIEHIKRRSPGRLATQRDFLYQCCKSAIELGHQHGCRERFFVTVNLSSDKETTGNALKPYRDAITPLLAEAPLIQFGVRVPAGKSVQAHLHIIALLPEGASEYLDEAVSIKNLGHPRALSYKPVDDMPGLMKYFAGEKNLGRTGASIVRSQVVIEHMAAPIFRNSMAPCGKPNSQPGPAISRGSSSVRTSVGFVSTTPAVTVTTSTAAVVASHPCAEGRDAALIDRQHRIDPTAVDARQCSAGAGDLANIPDAFDPETGEIIPDNDNASIVIHAGLFGNEVIERRVIDGFIHGIGHAAILMATKRTMVATGTTSDTLAAYLGVGQSHLENWLSGHDPLSAIPAARLKTWLLDPQPLPKQYRQRSIGRHKLKPGQFDLPLVA